MGLKFRRGTTAQKSGSLAFGEPYVNTDLGTLQIGGNTGDITLGASGTGSAGSFSSISGSGLDITGNANIAGNLTLGGAITIGDNVSDTVNVVASLSSSLIPSATNTFDLGSATKIWRDLYISTGSIKIVNPGTGTVVGTLSSNASGDFNTAGAISSSTITGLGALSAVTLYSGNGTLAGNRVVNLSSYTLNFSSSTNPNTLVMSGGTVGIGTLSPSYKLDVNGDINFPTTTGSTYGIIRQNGDRILHTYQYYNLFLGKNSGNFINPGSFNSGESFNILLNVSKMLLID
jgi:hypothetical protein